MNLLEWIYLVIMATIMQSIELLFNLKTGEHLLLRDYYKELFGVEVTSTNIAKI